MPRLNGSLRTCAPLSAATSAVRSVEPSDTTTTSSPGSRSASSSSRSPMLRSSLSAGMSAMRRTCASGSTAGATGSRSSTDTRVRPQADELEQAAGAVAVGVLVEDALARPTTHLLGLSGVVEQLAVGGDRLAGVPCEQELAARLEPALDPLVGARDDRRARRGALGGA